MQDKNSHIFFKSKNKEDSENMAKIKKKNNVVKKKDAIPNKKRASIPKSTQDTIPYDFVYENGIMELSPTKFSKTYSLEDVNFKTESEEKQTSIFFTYGDFLNSLTEGTEAQITIFNRSVSEEVVKKHILFPLKNDVLDELRVEENNMLSKKMKEGRNNLKKEKHITITTKSDSIDSAFSEFARMESQMNNTLGSLNNNSPIKEMTLVQRMELLYDMMHISEESLFKKKTKLMKNGVLDFKWLQKQKMTTKDVIAPMSIAFHKNYIELDDKYAQVLVVQDLAQFMSTDFLGDISDVPCNMLTSIHYVPIRQQDAKKMARDRLSIVKTAVLKEQKNAAKNGYSPELISSSLEEQYEAAKKTMKDVTSRNQKMFTALLTVMIYADSLDELEKNRKKVADVVDRYLCEAKILSYQQELAFGSTLPLGNVCIPIDRLMTTETAASFIPFAVQEISQKGGHYYGQNALSNNLIMLNRLNGKNFNGMILGTPGSGKSMAGKNEVNNAMLGSNDDVIIIDPEGEYRPIADLYGGEIIKIKPGTRTYLNPFDMDLDYANSEDGDEDPVTMKADYIAGICETILGNHLGLAPGQKTIIDRCVRELYKPYIEHMKKLDGITYDKDASPTMIDFYDLMTQQPEPEARDLALALELYARGSMQTFSHRTTVNTHSRLTVYDIRDIGTSLRSLGLQVCLNDAWNRMISNCKQGKRTWLFIDEFHLLVKHENSARFVNNIYKRARKWGGIPTGMTQNCEDLLNSSEARIILNNCKFVQMLDQSSIDRDELSALFNISETLQKYITNARPGCGLIYTDSTIIPFFNNFDKDTKLYKAMTTKLGEKYAAQNLEISFS